MIENDWNLLRDCSDFTQTSANPSYIKFYLKKVDDLELSHSSSFLWSTLLNVVFDF
jgi:hypothetical protein